MNPLILSLVCLVLVGVSANLIKLIRENRLDLYNKAIKFLPTRVELDFASFKEDIWSH